MISNACLAGKSKVLLKAEQSWQANETKDMWPNHTKHFQWAIVIIEDCGKWLFDLGKCCRSEWLVLCNA